MYKKRAGTSGIRGQLYETKLLSLILFKAQHNDNIEEFYLGTNMNDVGAFDDICLKAKIKGHSRPVAIFIQAKHRENEDKVTTLNNKTNLGKYFESFIKVKTKFEPNSKDKFFNGNYDDTECVFVLYTTEQGNFDDQFEGDCADILNELIATGDYGSKPHYTNEDIEFLCKIAMKEEMGMLATRFTKFIYNKNNDMNDELIVRYHVILANKVVQVSDIQPQGRRIAKFRFDFFVTKDDCLTLFRDQLYKELLKKHATKKRDKKLKEINIEALLSPFFSDPSDITLGDLIMENVIIYKNNRLEFVERVPEFAIRELRKINLPQAKIDLAISRAVKHILTAFTFQVPASFGNKDLTLKNEKRRNHIKNKLIELFENAPPSKIITLNETNTDDGFLQINGGLGGAVGNLLAYDEETKLLKVTDNFTLLENHSKALLEEFRNKFNNLQEYRLDVTVKDFPKLSFDYNDYNLVKEFFSKLVFFTNQDDENGVGKILKQEIDDLEGADAKSFRIKSDAIFLNFHEEIQKWWMQPKQAEYLTETSDLYQIAKSNIINDPMIRVISMMYMSEIGNIEYTFEDTTISFELVDLQSRNIIVTDITRLTLIKLIQCLKIKDFPVLDLKYMSNLPTSDFRALITELKKVPKENTMIIICDNLENCTSTLQRNSQDVARAVIDKSIIVITNKKFADMVMKHFQRATVAIDESNSLLDLNQDSQKNILKNAKAIFQGQEVILGSLIDEESIAFIKGAVFNKVLLNETIVIGQSLEFPSRPFELLCYDPTRLKYEIKDLYIDRRVSRNKMTESGCNCKLLQTLQDINDDVVLITAKPGMGKSTLLSYLSVKTKELDTKLWLLRINMLDYVKEFSKWKKDKTIIDIVEVLQFMCHALLKKEQEANLETISLSEENGEVYLKNSTDDEWMTFELVLFLHFFKKGNLIFLFDGFDEICPNYEDEVISFLNTIKDHPRRHKIWVTSRPYNKIKYILQQNFNISEPYELEPFSDLDQELYLEKFWQSNFTINEVNDTQTQNLKEFIDFMVNSHKNVFIDNFIRLNKPQNFLLNKVYFHFMVYLQNEMKVLPMDSPLDWGYKDKLNVSIRVSKHSQHMFRQNVGERGINDILEFVGTPLHLYLVAEYFLRGIKEASQETKQWDLDINTYAIYESFLESKLKKIRFQDKNKMDIDNPDIMETYETVRKEFIDMHKKLAAYAVFQINGQEIFNKEDLEEITRFIEKIERGSEKTGLIYSVANNIPQFIHMTFTEYFAVEYVSDLLKRERSNERQLPICDFIFNTMLFESPNNVLNIMDQKLKIDTEFAVALENNSKYIFNLLIAHDIEHDDGAARTQVKSHLFECISKDLNNFLSIFVSTLQRNINESNVDDFVKVIVNSGFLKLAVARQYKDLLETVLKLVRNIDKTKWRRFLSNPGYYCDDIIRHTQLQRFLRRHFLSFFIRSELCRLGSFMATNEEA